ncbi:hypothetical protein GCWU000321_01812 [Dialister invisus DSM 15470]|uniref:Uncharacterized protein n=1 Tax=Dialister invisus DSM 15470 TaxID=592028 RepID=C9LQI0_9FIRM|nr:hypothetical protein GCWU000321_01812 [Dialister invisus DSM 15470]
MPRESFDDEIQTAPWLSSSFPCPSVKGLRQADSPYSCETAPVFHRIPRFFDLHSFFISFL